MNQTTSEGHIQGYILTRDWRDEPGGCRLTIWAATDNGPLKVIMDDIQPVMFIRRGHRRRAQQLLPATAWPREVALTTLDGEAVLAVYFRRHQDLERARERLQQQNIECLEADIRPAERFLMERFIRGSFEADPTSGQRGDTAGATTLTNPKLRQCDYRPRLSLMALDIETDGNAGEIYSIAYIHDDQRRVLMRGAPDATADDAALTITPCRDERELLERFIEAVQTRDPDVLVGWNVINFDLTIMAHRCRELKLAFTIGREAQPGRIVIRSGVNMNAVARIPGRVVLDGIECLRAAFWTFESYSLENVSRELLGRGKIIAAEEDKAGEITRLFREDKNALARYNLEDCQLVLDIFARTDLLEFVIERTQLTGLAMGRQGGSVAAFDYLYLPRLHRRGRVAPSLTRKTYADASPGGYVLDSVPGIHDNVAVMDFKSLYPSIIRTFKVDPLGLAQPGDDAIPGFLGARFSRTEHLLPGIIEDLWRRRDEARRAGNQPLAQAIKILMNSFYGVLGTDGCRFYDPRLASSITRRGHEIIQASRDWIQEQGFQVIYGDTDSLFVLLGDPGRPLEQAARELVGSLNRYWTQTIEREHRLHSYLEIELETLFRKFFMPRIRGSDAGSKKRYAGMTGDDRESLTIKGLEAVRSDWTELARAFQRELLYTVFQEQDAESLIREYVQRVYSGQADDSLVYRKRLRQPLSAYRKHIPPHVKAARQLDKPGNEVRYCITTGGPQPVEKRDAPLDYDHYIERQIKPVADGILPFVGLDFDRLIGGQGDLFQ